MLTVAKNSCVIVIHLFEYIVVVNVNNLNVNFQSKSDSKISLTNVSSLNDEK